MEKKEPVKSIISLTEKKSTLGFIAALLTAVGVLFGHVVYKDRQVSKWVEKTILCEQDKIKRLDVLLSESRDVLNKTQELLQRNDSILKTKIK